MSADDDRSRLVEHWGWRPAPHRTDYDPYKYSRPLDAAPPKDDDKRPSLVVLAEYQREHPS